MLTKMIGPIGCNWKYKMPAISIDKYRRLLNDYESTDEQITERLEYLESLCRNIIRNELKEYAEEKRK
jgi:hypothetical protein